MPCQPHAVSSLTLPLEGRLEFCFLGPASGRQKDSGKKWPCSIFRQMGLLQYHRGVKNHRMSGPDGSCWQEPKVTLQVAGTENQGPHRMMASQWTPRAPCPLSCYQVNSPKSKEKKRKGIPGQGRVLCVVGCACVWWGRVGPMNPELAAGSVL